jgi:putative ABC transport system substrate-binding protein
LRCDEPLTDRRELDILHWVLAGVDRMQFDQLKRREFITLLGGATIACPLPLSAQAPTRLPRVGVLWPGSSPDKWDEAFRQGLHTLGYVEGRNILLEYRWAEGKQERLRGLAEELVGLKVDLIVTISAPAILAAKQATTTIPIVFAGTSDPVRTGFAASLARPGGNLTGLSLMAPDLAGKRLAFIKSLVPTASRIAMLWNGSDEGMAIRVKEAQLAAPAIQVTLLSPELRTLTDLESAFASLNQDPPDALLIFVDPFRHQHACRLCTRIGSFLRPEVSCLTDQVSRTIVDAPRPTWIKFSKAQSLATCRLSSRPNLNWW